MTNGGSDCETGNHHGKNGEGNVRVADGGKVGRERDREKEQCGESVFSEVKVCWIMGGVNICTNTHLPSEQG